MLSPEEDLEDVEKPLGPSNELPEEPLEAVETRPERAIKNPFAPFIEPQLSPRARTPQREEEPNDDPPVIHPRQRSDERYGRPRFYLPQKVRKFDDVFRKGEADEDLIAAFPHVHENYKFPPSKRPRRDRKGWRLGSVLVSMFKHPLGTARGVAESQRRPSQHLTGRVDQVSDLEVTVHIMLL